MVASVYGPDEAVNQIWVFLEHEDTRLRNISLELLGKARELADPIGWSVVGLLFGYRVKALAEEAFTHGADEVRVSDDPMLAEFTVEAYTALTEREIRTCRPSIFLCGATLNGRDLAGRLAVRFRTGLTADCINVWMNEDEPGQLIAEVTGFGGGISALIHSPIHRPQMVTVRPGVFPTKEPIPHRSGKTVEVPAALNDVKISTRVVERVKGAAIDLTQAKILIVGGRGIEGRFDLLRSLAFEMGAEIGATRPPVDEGHVERERQIGQTGVVCRPKVAMVFGASGAFQFTVGIQEADLVVAVNKDPDAPIFQTADYCIVSDALELIPHLTELFRKTRRIS